MRNRPDVYLENALRALRQFPRFLAQRSLSEYLLDELCQSAVERQLQIAGEALGQLCQIDATLFGRIPQGDLIIACRQVLAHGYATLDQRRVYDMASSSTVELQRVVEQLLSAMPEEEGKVEAGSLMSRQESVPCRTLRSESGAGV